MEHPKIHPLSDKCFRLWIWGLCYCQRYLTDGAIPLDVIPQRLRRAASDLIAHGMWNPAEEGYQVRDYLQWNDSKAEVAQKRQQTRDRVTAHRSKPRSEDPVTRYTSLAVPNESDHDLVGDPEDREEKLAKRAGRLLQELYPAWYSKYRNKAKLRIVSNSLAFQDALSLVTIWDDARLEKLARIVLTTDEEWIKNTDRSFRIFAARASWADDRLRQLEAAQVATS